MQWQPIETASKDTSVLLYYCTAGGLCLSTVGANDMEILGSHNKESLRGGVIQVGGLQNPHTGCHYLRRHC